jgi:hypothetical protein
LACLQGDALIHEEGTGESPEQLRCFVQLCHEDGYHPDEGNGCQPPVELAFSELPAREYRTGFGGTEGPPFIAFSERYVYISVQYDGCEWIEAIPRHPESLGKTIPWPGG